MHRKFFTLLVFALSTTVMADPLNDGMEVGSSVSQSHDGRNVFVNPAALGFQTDLNGGGPMTSFMYGVNQGRTDEFSTSLSLSYFGFGVEALSGALGKFQRYNFGLGVPIHPKIYAGVRLQLQSAENPAQGTPTNLDVGLQVRPSKYFSLGFLANHSNQTVKQYVFGATLRPLSWLDLSADLDTPSNDFFRKVSYQATASAEVLPGVRLLVGYHQEYRLQLGLQVSYGFGSFVGRSQPQSDSRRFVLGLVASPIPYRSALAGPTALRLDIDSSLSEEGFPGNLLSGPRPSLAGLLKQIAEAEKAPPPVVVVHLESFPLGLAAAQEVFDALSRLREKGSRIEVFLGNPTLREYLIASVAHAIHMEKSGSLTIVGLKAESYFAKGTLDKLGVQGEFLARGKYKSAPEMFTRTEGSDAHRSSVKEQLAEAEKQVLLVLGKYRGIDAKRWREITEHAVWSAADLQAAKLIDSVDSFAHKWEELESRHVYRDNTRVRENRLALRPRVAVIPVSGDILASRNGLLALSGRGAITPDRVDGLLSQALSDSRTKAIVLRVNSGGGEILASEQIAHLVEKAGKRKPIYLSMGDAAASGGYYIAIPAKRVFADPLTLTGSIGVFLGKFNFAGTYQWLKLHKEILSNAPYPGLFSEHQPWSAAERALLVRQMNQYYESFVGYVADKRGLSPTAAESAAQGRVWLGSSARELKLVDELGGITHAVRHAAKEVSISDYETWVVGDASGLFSISGGDLLGKGQSSLDQMIPPPLSREVFWWSRLSKQPFLFLSPIDSL